MILVVGSKGNMGQRYGSILHDIGKTAAGFDISEHPPELLHELAAKCSQIIIATPTHTHFKLIVDLAKHGAPILCEKPITKDWHELASLITLCETDKINLQMVNQYENMLRRDQRKPTEGAVSLYNHYKHGDDGLVWDCINIVGLAEGKVILSEISPQWICCINNFTLNLSDMGRAYRYMIEEWIAKPTPNIEYIEKSHNKIFEHLSGGGDIECHYAPKSWYSN